MTHGLLSSRYRRRTPGVDPAPDFPDYHATALRHPKHPLIIIPQTLSELTGPVYPYGRIGQLDNDLTRQHAGEPIGQRMVVHGRVLDESGQPVPNTLVEIWQANAAGRYRHRVDEHDAPLDPNFSGAGRTVTDGDGRYRFITIKPGPYPWLNHHNAWRPAHIHFSLFGTNFLTRLVTQMYFPGDELQSLDPILNSIRDAGARQRLVASFDIDRSVPQHALAYRWDIVLRGREGTPMESR